MSSAFLSWLGRRRALPGLGTRGSVTFSMGAALPVLVIGMAGSVEVTSWAATKVGVQRTADVAAVAGAINYRANTNYTTTVNSPGAKQTAATFAARMAQLNGASGMAAPTWNANTTTLNDNQITVQFVSGQQSSSNNAIQVTVSKTLNRTMSRFFSSDTSVTVGATSTAELITQTVPGTGGSPCVVALGTNGVTTGNAISLTGSAQFNAPSCTVRSNSGLSTSGSVSVVTQAAYLGGTYTHTGSSSLTGTLKENQGQIPDPYAGRSDLLAALTAANSATGTGMINCSGSGPTCSGPGGSVSCASGYCTIQPGTYSGLSLSGSGGVILAPGRYVFTGGIAISGSSTFTASSVTILMAASHSGSPNAMTVTGSATVAISAASTTTAANQQLPGIVFGSQSTATSNITGSSSDPRFGVIYYPNGEFDLSGSSGSGSTGCAVLIAKTITLTGSSSFDATDCSSYDVPVFFSLPSTSILNARLVH